MKILVCMKVIYEPKGEFFDYNCPLRINRPDEYALEEALVIKDNFPDTVVDVLSVGNRHSLSLLKKALERGADSLKLIETEEGLSAKAVGNLIAKHCGEKYDLIFTGVMSEDFNSAIVGPSIAGYLNIPFATSVLRSEIFNGEYILAYCELEGGVLINYKLKLPCLIAMQSGGRDVRYPTLTNKLKARNIEPDIIKADVRDDDFLNSTYSKYNKAKGVIVEGTLEEKCEFLYNQLHKRGLL